MTIFNSFLLVYQRVTLCELEAMAHEMFVDLPQMVFFSISPCYSPSQVAWLISGGTKMRFFRDCWSHYVYLICHDDRSSAGQLRVFVCWMYANVYIWLVVWNIFYDFPYIGNSNPNWLIFFRGVETTHQIYTVLSIYLYLYTCIYLLVYIYIDIYMRTEMYVDVYLYVQRYMYIDMI